MHFVGNERRKPTNLWVDDFVRKKETSLNFLRPKLSTKLKVKIKNRNNMNRFLGKVGICGEREGDREVGIR